MKSSQVRTALHRSAVGTIRASLARFIRPIVGFAALGTFFMPSPEKAAARPGQVSNPKREISDPLSFTLLPFYFSLSFDPLQNLNYLLQKLNYLLQILQHPH